MKSTKKTRLLIVAAALLASLPALADIPICQPVGIAVDATRAFVTAPFQQLGACTSTPHGLYRITGPLTMAFLAPLPPIPGTGIENYIAIAPGLGGFTPGDVFVTSGSDVLKYIPGSPGSFMTFSTSGPSVGSHAGITFDTVGTFGFNMIVTGDNGIIVLIDHNGVAVKTITPVLAGGAGTPIELESPRVAPLGFGPYGGEVWVAGEASRKLYAISGDGTTTALPAPFPAPDSPESIEFLPPVVCSATIGTTKASYFDVLFGSNSIGLYNAASHPATVIVNEEFSGLAIFVNPDGSAGSTFVAPGVQQEGTAIVTPRTDTPSCKPPLPTSPGRMTGGGSVFETNGTRVTHGFELHCDVADVPNSLEINWGGDRFHLDTLTAAFCFTDPNIKAGHPKAPFNTYVGTGTGSFDGIPGATANWTFTDAGEPGTSDMATIRITDVHGNVVLNVSGLLAKGNQQAHSDNK